MDITQIIQNREGTILDVRTPGEFQMGHIEGAINIPLHQLLSRLEEVKSLEGPIVLCCASGGRSAQACLLLSDQEVVCCDAGSWLTIQQLQMAS